MIADDYFIYWIENVVASAKLIADPSVLANVWLSRETGITSAYSCDELLEQMLGDLELEEHLNKFADDLRGLGVLEDVGAFTQSLLDIEAIRKADPRLERPENLLASSQWKNLQIVAKRVGESPTLNIRV